MKTKFRGKEFTLSITQSATINGILKVPEFFMLAHHEAYFEGTLLYSLSYSFVLSSNSAFLFSFKNNAGVFLLR